MHRQAAWFVLFLVLAGCDASTPNADAATSDGAVPPDAAMRDGGALSIAPLSVTQVPTNTSFVLNPMANVATGVTWSKEYGPDWVEVDPSTGAITGTTNDVGEAHYVGVRAASSVGTDVLTFILVVGDQAVFTMDGVDGNPGTILEARDMMSPGDVLIIPDGDYSGPDNTINGNDTPGAVDGSPSGYTTLIAATPLGASFDSVYHRGGEYVAYKGFRLRGAFTVSGEERFGVVSNHVKVMLSSSEDGGFAAIVGAEYVLFEDDFAYGGGRHKFRVGSNGAPARFIIFRRCVARHDYTLATDPTAIFMHYGGEDVLFQNCLAIDQASDEANFVRSGEHDGLFETRIGARVAIEECLGINNVFQFHFGDRETSDVSFTNSVFWGGGTGSTSLSANATYDHLTVGDVNAQNDENCFDDRSGSTSVRFSNSIFYDIEGTGSESGLRSKRILYEAPESTHNLFWAMRPDIIPGDAVDSTTTVDPRTGDPGNGTPGLRSPVRIESGSDADALGVGATVMLRRGRSGAVWDETGYDELTDDSLWPWPNEHLIAEQMGAYRYDVDGIVVNGSRGFAAAGTGLYGGPVTLTSYIWEYLGTACPAPFCVGP